MHCAFVRSLGIENDKTCWRERFEVGREIGRQASNQVGVRWIACVLTYLE